MGKAQKLTTEEIETHLRQMSGWVLKENFIEKMFLFKDFNEAFAFMTEVATHADKADHHPDWSNVYNRVHVKLSTHDSGGITQKDIDLARKMDSIKGRD
jgi:4a-hydroxytetrahydrobiopterin dehydratase